MWIEKINDEDGKIVSYKYVERFEDPLTGKERRVSMNHSKKTKAVQEEMLKKLNEKIKDKLSKQVTPYDKTTFSELIDRWLKYYKTTVKLSTYIGNEQKADKIKDAFGNILVKNIHETVLNEYIESLLVDKGLVRNTAKLYKYTIEYVLNYGIRKGYPIDRDIVSQLDLPNINLSKKNVLNYLERNELKALVDALYDNGYEQYARLTIVQANTGMRIGEILALNYREDLDFDKDIINIDKTFDLNNYIITSTKNEYSTRKISFNATTKQALKDQIQHLKMLTLKRNYSRDNTILFMTMRQNPVNYKHFNTILDKVNPIEEKHVTSHTFRHTFITMMIEQGVPLNLIAKHVGHANTKMIEEVYAHFTDKMDDDLQEAISKLEVM